MYFNPEDIDADVYFTDIDKRWIAVYPSLYEFNLEAEGNSVNYRELDDCFTSSNIVLADIEDLHTIQVTSLSDAVRQLKILGVI